MVKYRFDHFHSPILSPNRRPGKLFRAGFQQNVCSRTIWKFSKSERIEGMIYPSCFEAQRLSRKQILSLFSPKQIVRGLSPMEQVSDKICGQSHLPFSQKLHYWIVRCSFLSYGSVQREQRHIISTKKLLMVTIAVSSTH